MTDANIDAPKALRLTNKAISSALDYRVAMTRAALSGGRLDETIASFASQIEELAKPLMAPVQVWLDKVNGRAAARTISTATEILDCAIEVEVELRSKGVTIGNMKGTTVYLRSHAGFKNVSTGVRLEYRATGWYVTGIEKTYHDRSQRKVCITPAARADIIAVQLSGYGDSTANAPN